MSCPMAELYYVRIVRMLCKGTNSELLRPDYRVPLLSRSETKKAEE